MSGFNLKAYDAEKFYRELKMMASPPIDSAAMVLSLDWRRLFQRYCDDENLVDATAYMSALAFLMDDGREPIAVYETTSGAGLFTAPWSRDTQLIYEEVTSTGQSLVLREQLVHEATAGVSHPYEDFLQFWRDTKDGKFDDQFPSEDDSLRTLVADLPADALDKKISKAQYEAMSETEKLRVDAAALDEDALDAFLAGKQKQQDEEEERRRAEAEKDLRVNVEDFDDEDDFKLSDLDDDAIQEWNKTTMKDMDQDEERPFYEVAGRLFIAPAAGARPPSFVTWASAQPDRRNGSKIVMTKKGSGPFPGTVTVIGAQNTGTVEQAIKAYSKKKVVFQN